MKTILFRVYIVLAILAIAGIRLASPVWIEDSPEVKAQQEAAFLYDVETRLIYVAGGVEDTTLLIQYAYYDPSLIYDDTWQRMLIHTTLTVEQADEYLRLLDAPESEQGYYQEVLAVAGQCREYGDHLIDAVFAYGYSFPDQFVEEMGLAEDSYLRCREMFNDLAEKYNLFQEPLDMDST